MNVTAFWVTWLIASSAIQLYSNHRINKRVDRMHKLNKTIKGE